MPVHYMMPLRGTPMILLSSGEPFESTGLQLYMMGWRAGATPSEDHQLLPGSESSLYHKAGALKPQSTTMQDSQEADHRGLPTSAMGLWYRVPRV